MSRPAAWFPAGRGRISATRTTRLAVDELLDELDLAGLPAVTADLARSAADLVDAARARQDPKLWLTAATRLEVLLAKLTTAPVRARTDGDNDQDQDQEVHGGDDQPSPAARMAQLVGLAPSILDEA